MGSGKSTVIIPYLVYTNLINNIKTIVIIPDNQQIKNEMIDNISCITTLFKKKCFIYNNEAYYSELLDSKIDLILLTYTEIKDIFLYLSKMSLLSNYTIYIDEVDMFLDPCTCEYNVKKKESPVDKKTIDTLLNYINHIDIYDIDNNNIDIIDDNKILSIKTEILMKYDGIDNNNNNNNQHYKKIIDNQHYKKIIDNLDFFKKFLVKQTYNKHYGIGHAGKYHDGIKIPLLPIAKPYKYVNVPLIDSDFSEIYIQIYTTYYSYMYYNSYTYEQIEYILFVIIPEYIKQNKNISDDLLNEILIKCLNDNSDCIQHIKNIRQKSRLKDYLSYNDDIKRIIVENFYNNIISKDRNQLLYIISHVQTKELKILENLYNVTNYDVLICTKSIGFTGTPWVYLPNEVQKFDDVINYNEKFNKYYESISGQNYKMFNILYTTEYKKIDINDISIYYDNKHNGLIDVGY